MNGTWKTLMAAKKARREARSDTIQAMESEEPVAGSLWRTLVPSIHSPTMPFTPETHNTGRCDNVPSIHSPTMPFTPGTRHREVQYGPHCIQSHHAIHTWNKRHREVQYGPQYTCLLYTSPSPRDQLSSSMPSSA